MTAVIPVLAILLTACADGAPSVSVEASGTTSAQPSMLEATELTGTSDPLPPGRYTREAFAPRVTLELDGSWFAVQRLPGFFDVQQDVGSPDVIAVQFAKPDRVYGADGAGVLVEDAATAAATLEANEDLTVVETSESLMGGLSGHQLTIENTSGAYQSVMHVPPGPLSIDTGRRLWVAFFDTPDGLLAVMVGGSTAKWQEALDAAEPVLESVTIGQ